MTGLRVIVKRWPSKTRATYWPARKQKFNVHNIVEEWNLYDISEDYYAWFYRKLKKCLRQEIEVTLKTAGKDDQDLG